MLAAPDGDVTCQVEDVAVHFGGVQALKGINLSFKTGQVFGIIGPNGAGKTTFFDAICGVVPMSGKVRLLGNDITNLPTHRRAQAGIRRTFQRQQPFNGLSVLSNVLAALDWHGGKGGWAADLFALPGRRNLERERLELARAVVDEVGLGDYKDDPVEQLPIGLQRMVELARVIVDNPTVLLLDEPTSGLGVGELESLGRVVDRVRTKASVLLIEHDVQFVMRHSDRVAVFTLGSVLMEGAPSEVQANEDVRRLYLGQG